MRAAAFFGRVDDLKWLPLRFSHFYRRGREGKLPVNRCALPHEKERERYPQRRAFAESGAANAVCLYDPSREKAILENPRLRSNESPSGAFKRQSGLR